MSGGFTRIMLNALEPAALGEVAQILRARASKIEPEESQFPHRLRFPAGGEEWTGPASDALQARSTTVGRTYGDEHSRLGAAADVDDQAQGFLSDSVDKTRGKIREVEAQDVTLGTPEGMYWPCGKVFTVADDFTVQVGVMPAGFPEKIYQAVKWMAAAHTEDIKRLVTQLEELGDDWGKKHKEALDLSKLALDSKGKPFGNYDPSKTAHEQAKAIADGSMTVPSDPKQLHDLWEQLSPSEKDDIYDRYHDIGNHGGIPFDPPGDHRGRDYYNQEHLKEILDGKKKELADALQNQPTVPIGPDGGQYEKDWQAWKAKCDELQNEVNGYQNVRNTLDRSVKDHMPRFLGIVDENSHAAISIYNPDYAKDHGTIVPGTFSDLNEMGSYDDHSAEMIKSATIASHGQLHEGQLSMTEYLGYDRPMTISGIEGKPPWAGDPALALNGAQGLCDFQDGIRSSHEDGAVGGLPTTP